MTAFQSRLLDGGPSGGRRWRLPRLPKRRLPSGRWKIPDLRDRRVRKKALLWGAGLFVLYVAYIWFTLPDISDPTSFLASQSTVITDRNGIELYRLYNEQDRTFVPGDAIPKSAKQALIAIEDQRFYDRGCLDMRALARVVLFFGTAGGGSTITRQLARNALDLQKDNRVERKIKEVILGCQLERRFDKEHLLELYLNWIPFGQNAYGIQQASSTYFNTSADKLTLAQSAILAALPQRPSYFSPYGNHVRTTVSDAVKKKILAGKITSATQISDDDVSVGLVGAYAGTGSHVVYVGGRTDQVLRNMQNLGFITEADRLTALQQLETIKFQAARQNIRASHFVLQVKDEVENLFKGTVEEGLLEKGGLHIQTTLDWDLQQIADKVVADHREDTKKRFGADNIALVSVNPETNEILAYVGNVDYNDTEHGGKIDMARVPRQPGSSFKPFVYASAFRNGATPATVLWDVPTKIGNDTPQDFDGRFWGPVTIRKALAGSRNIPAAKAYFLGGEEDQILALVSAMGAPTPLEKRHLLTGESGSGSGTFGYGWPLALGAAETPLTEMVSAYGTFARAGKAMPLVDILKVTDKKGNLLYERPADPPKDVLDPGVAYQIVSVLSDESARPTDFWRTQLTVPGYQTAAKTGTSNKCMEWLPNADPTKKVCKLRKPDNAWVMGFTPSLLTGVWSGNANSDALFDKGDGLNTSSPIWRDFMVAAHRKLKDTKTTFPVPDDVIQPQISTLSGELPTSCTPVEFRRPDVFLADAPPTLPDPGCAELMVDRVTGLLASDGCPADARSSGSYLVPRVELEARFPDWKKSVDDWVKTQMVLWNARPDHSGSLLPMPVAPTEKCDPSLTPGRMEKPTLEITAPAQNGTATYPAFRPSVSFKSGSAVHEVRYAIDGHPVATVSTAPFSVPIRVPRSIPQSGTHTLTVTLVDTYFNTAEESVRFTFEDDKRSPQVRFLIPTGDATAPRGSVLRMRAEALDQESGLKYVQFYMDGTLLTTKPSEPFDLEYKLKEGPGPHTLEVRATDMAGNMGSATVTVTIE